MGDVVQLREPRPSDIGLLLSQPWPANRKTGDFRDLLRAQADQELRRVICGHCAKKSPLLDGPKGRAWWKTHQTKCRRAA